MSGLSPEEQGQSRHAGRQLDPSRAAAIMAAALEGLAEVGYDRLSMGEIAARAHAGKDALYRRWPSKAALVVDAVAAWRQRFAPLTIPDTGSLRGDLELLREVARRGLARIEQGEPPAIPPGCLHQAQSACEALFTHLSKELDHAR